jgi:glycosyltransferase involved in cell wall biosynthesis
MAKPRIAIVVSHPIQYFCPAYSSFARESYWDVAVGFGSTSGFVKQWDPSFSREIAWEDMKLDFPHTFLNGEAALPITSGLDAPRLANWLSEYAPSVVVVYGYSQRLQRRALRWARAARCPVLMISDSEARHATPLMRRAMKRVVLPPIYRRVSGFLSVGDANEDYYQHYGVPAHRLYRSPFPIDRERLEDAYRRRNSLRHDAREALGIRAQEFVCGVVGKLVARKRQTDAIEALGHLSSMGRDAAVLLVGSGEDESRLREQSSVLKKHRALFPGFVQPRDLTRLYAAMDLYIHCSEEDPHPLAVSEAIYMGLPSIVSDRCGSFGPSDDVQPGRNGFVYPCGDHAALAGLIGRFANDSPLLDEFGCASRSIALASQKQAHGGGLHAALTALGFL